MNKYHLWCSTVFGNLISLSVAGISIGGEVTQEESVTPNAEEYNLTTTPLAEQLFTQPTAKQLQQGELILNFDNRLFFLPDLVPGGVDDEDTAVNFNTGFVWGITDKLQLALQFQFLDSSTPARQGDFTSERTENQGAAGELKYRLWQNTSQTQALSGVVSASWGTRGFRFIGEETETEINNRNVFVALAIPYTAEVGNKWQFTISPTVAFFNDKNAGFFHRLPGEDEEFGTVFGFAGGIAYEINPRLFIWGDVFVPLTGNNSISRSSGEPDTAIAYNSGIRYLVNPRLALDVYASNTFGSFGPLSLTADRDLIALGTNLTFMPDVVAANRKYSDRFNEESQDIVTPLTTDGLAFFDGGVVSSQDFIFNFQLGSQGILTALRYGFLKDFEGAIYLDYIFSDVDESEQGYSAKLRLLNQAEGSPVTLSLAATVGITNQPFINFLENDRDEFERQDLDKEIPIFTPGGDDIDEGKQLIVTFALPIHYQIATNTAVWFTPIVGYVQREGTELAGFNLGGSVGISSELSAVAEFGANFRGEGNTFGNNGLEDAIPWTLAIRWTPLSLFGLEPSEDNTNPQLEFYLTNRVGSSTWHQLRVRDDNDLAVGVGLQFPF
ncbi:conserved hypothetical protein [Hyella patelloides LEGE 07179]|uniref:Uncharacterized protein n=1 Tax=Hyella patelloides LEGE 07179 TaxID=945734 RepID=A0A563VW67_9CYAN|nr:hypothetical protein [Hyella patelloides]VEP15699.1 conserved hypothetical protein [Hyella patelloides LEGE 07179]